MRLFFASLFVLSLIPAAKAQELPAGKGKDVVENVCSACHGVDLFSSMRLRKGDWQDVVNSMKTRGADGTDADFKTIVDYLAKFLGDSVNVNKAAAKELAAELDITTQEAEAIVQHRKDKGDFKIFADLEKVAGLDIKKIEPLKARIAF